MTQRTTPMGVQKTVAIIGGKGKYGRALASIFTAFGCRVVTSDRERPNESLRTTAKRNRTVVAEAEVVVFAVPPVVTEAVIAACVPAARPDQLWLDVTSFKVTPVAAMLQSSASVVGLHPMFAPQPLPWRGQKVVVCRARVSRAWQQWLDAFLKFTGAAVKEATATEHDWHMTIVQALTHATELIRAMVTRSMHGNVAASADYASPVYTLAMSPVQRILSNDPELYADIQFLNPQAPIMLRAIEASAERLRKLIEKGDRKGFVAEFAASRSYFGEAELTKGNEQFIFASRLLADLSNGNAVRLVSHCNQPGVLARITAVFAAHNVNLTSIHTRPVANGYEYHIGVESDWGAAKVRATMAELLADTELAITEE